MISSTTSIIKINNLSYSANSIDIRDFFYGLNIPRNEIYIIGGSQKGVAFVSFSTFEDARQAMLLNGTFLNGTKISLTYSSYFEIVNVLNKVFLQRKMAGNTLVPITIHYNVKHRNTTMGRPIAIVRPRKVNSAIKLQSESSNTIVDRDIRLNQMFGDNVAQE